MKSAPLRLVFAGTPEFAATILEALSRSHHPIAAVLCRPDKPAGRGRQLREPPVKRLALDLGLPVLQPPTLRDPDAQQSIAAFGCDVMVVAAYGLILPAAVLSGPRLGCVNVHASLLPRWRGAAPIQRAIEAGDRETGITIMQMDAGLDTGPMLLARSIAIDAQETGGALHDRLAELGARMIVEALDRMSEGSLIATPQPDDGVTYAARLQRTDEWLDWNLSAEALANRIRAFDPEPGTRTAIVDRPDAQIKVWSARALPLPCEARPGTVLEVTRNAVRVACAMEVLELLEVQRPGGRRQAVRDWLQSAAIGPGDRLGNPADRPQADAHAR